MAGFLFEVRTVPAFFPFLSFPFLSFPFLSFPSFRFFAGHAITVGSSLKERKIRTPSGENVAGSRELRR
jgi:hypothetical protein